MCSLSAFETGSLSEAQCDRRGEQLAANVAKLRSRNEELAVVTEHASIGASDADELVAMRRRIEQSVTSASVPARKAFLHALMYEIRVEGRDPVVPWVCEAGGADPKVRALVGYGEVFTFGPEHAVRDLIGGSPTG